MISLLFVPSQFFWRQFFVLQKCSLNYSSKKHFSRVKTSKPVYSYQELFPPLPCHGGSVWVSFCLLFLFFHVEELESDERSDIFLKLNNCGKSSTPWKRTFERTIQAPSHVNNRGIKMGQCLHFPSWKWLGGVGVKLRVIK